MISNPGEDTAITPDGKYVVVVDGSGGSAPISVVSIALRKEVSTLSVANNHDSVDVLKDGSVLVTSYDSNHVFRLTINSAGKLTNTGESLSVNGPNNVYGSPNARSGVVVSFDSSTVQSFTIPGLTLVDTRTLPGSGLCGVINPAGDKIYVRTTDGQVVAYSFDSTTGALGAGPLFTLNGAIPDSFFGMDQMAITPDGARLYLPQGNLLQIYDAGTGSLIDTILNTDFTDLTGVTFGRALTKIDPQSVGGEVNSVDKFTLIMPWLVLGAVVLASGMFLGFMMARR